jgi:hypothetical protein
MILWRVSCEVDTIATPCVLRRSKTVRYKFGTAAACIHALSGVWEASVSANAVSIPLTQGVDAHILCTWVHFGRLTLVTRCVERRRANVDQRGGETRSGERARIPRGHGLLPRVL